MQFENATEARAALRAIVSDPAYGTSALADPGMTASLLRDLLPDAPREADLLMAAVRIGLPRSCAVMPTKCLTPSRRFGWPQRLSLLERPSRLMHASGPPPNWP